MATKMNKKMIFRSPLAVLLLAASMLGLGAVSLVSCGTSDQKQPDNPDNQKNTTAETTAPVETEALFDDEMPERDMNGFELNILNYTETALGWALKISTEQKKPATSSMTPFMHATAALKIATTQSSRKNTITT